MTSRVMTRACLPTSLLDLVSAEWCPQWSQVKLMMMKSEKQGTLVRQVRSWPGSKQTSQGTSKPTGSQVSRSDSSKGFTKLSLSPMNSPYSSCCISDSMPLGLQPIASSSSLVRLNERISMFLSILGAKGFLMLELPLGSRKRRVRGKCFPSLQIFSLSRNACNFPSSSARAGSPVRVEERSSQARSRMDSIVVISALLAGGKVSSNSSISKEQCSDLITSLLRSCWPRQRKRISTPQSGSLPANCTSLLLSPQWGQQKAQIMISRKRGMQAKRMVVEPAWWQLGHSVSAIVAEWDGFYALGFP